MHPSSDLPSTTSLPTPATEPAPLSPPAGGGAARLLRPAVLALTAALAIGLSSAWASSAAIDFEAPTYATGTVHLQDGWRSAGAAGSGCAAYDHKVVANVYGYTAFGGQSLRLSNAVTSGCFGDQTFSQSLVDEAGETTAGNGGLSGGVRQPYYEAQWDFASTVPGAHQPGLSVVASPDRGDGARMSWVQMADTPTGLAVNFYDYQTGVNETGCTAGTNFVLTNVAGGLDRTVPHTVKVAVAFVDGPANDVVKVYVDGALGHTGTSWEDYFRECEGNPSRTVDSILFRTSGVAAPATLGKGFVVDNLRQYSGPALVGPPADKDACKNGGWATFNVPRTFSNQGDCIQFVNTGR